MRSPEIKNMISFKNLVFDPTGADFYEIYNIRLNIGGNYLSDRELIFENLKV